MYLSRKDVEERYSISRTTIWRYVRDGKMPTPVTFPGNLKRWRLSDLEEFEKSLKH